MSEESVSQEMESQIEEETEPVSELESQFRALEIPANIDPQLLALWLQREQDEIDRQEKKKPKKQPVRYGRKLSRLFAAYIGIAVMCLSIVLGLIQHKEPTEILNTTCIVFLVYTIIGFFVGITAENCVNDSVETMLREIVRRGQEAAEVHAGSQADLIPGEVS
jgi:hypothetical protein